jgi:phosphotransferase system enzyme I (PtsI)
MQINGIAAAPGISIGRAHVVRKSEIVTSGVLLNENETIKEIERFDQAVQEAVDDVEKMKTNPGLNNNEIEILETHIEFLTDPQIKSDVIAKIHTHKRNVTDSVIEVIHEAVHAFKNMTDEYMRARAADIQDVGDRIVKKLNHSETVTQKLEPNTIIIAEDISPSDTIGMDMTRVIGFATHVGGKTSHTAILAKSKGISAVVGCGAILNSINDEDLLIVDGLQGVVVVNPDVDQVAAYTARKDAYDVQLRLLRSLKGVPAITADGQQIQLLANISDADDMEEALGFGAEGAGLFRTELLYMNRNSFPTEEEQFEYYKKVAIGSRSKPVIVRTLDIGGDKQVSYFGLPAEENPFLGYRAIRICLDRKDIFSTQLRAILRASVFGNFKIMFPMICDIQELRRAKEILSDVKDELTKHNVDFKKNIKVGIMIEVPSAAITADILAKEVDFFSIGTNDLCQYTLAVDRGNDKIKDLYDPFNPGVLRLINNVIEQGHKNKIEVGMCGELASDPDATLLLMGMGLTEFSMSANSIPLIKKCIIENTRQRAKEVCDAVMMMNDSESISAYLQKRNQ